MNEADFYKRAKDNGLNREEAKAAWQEYSNPESGSSTQQNAPKVDETPMEQGVNPVTGGSNILPWLKGAAKKLGESTVLPLNRILAASGNKAAENRMPNLVSSMTPKNEGETQGGTGADFLTMATGGAAGEAAISKAPYLMKLAERFPALVKSFGFTVPGVLQHQAQNYGETGQVHPIEAGLETALGTTGMAGASKLPEWLKARGVGALERAVNPSGNLKGTDLEPALQGGSIADRLSRYFGGMKDLEKRVTGDVSAAGETQRGTMNEAGIDGRRLPILESVARSIKMRPDQIGKQGLNAAEREAALKVEPDWYGKDKLTSDELLNLRQKAQDVAFQTSKDVNLSGKTQYARTLQKKLNQYMDEEMANKADPNVLEQYSGARKTLQQKEPIRQAVNERVENPLKGFWDNPSLWMIPKTLVRSVNRTPGGAQALYDLGQVAGSKTGRMAGRAAGLYGRSKIFSPDLAETP